MAGVFQKQLPFEMDNMGGQHRLSGQAIQNGERFQGAAAANNDDDLDLSDDEMVLVRGEHCPQMAEVRTVSSCRRVVVTSGFLMVLLSITILAAAWPMNGGLHAL